MPLLEDIKDVLSFAAFRPDPDDAGISWKDRYAGRRSLLVNINRNSASWRAVGKRGTFQESGNQEGEFGEIVPGRAEEWRGLTDHGWCSLSLNNRFIISLETNLSRKENYLELLRTNPRAVLGAKYDRGKRYALFHHPDTTSTLLMACDDGAVKSAEDILRGNGLKTGRVCCGLFAMLETKLRDIYDGKKPEAKNSFMLVAVCEGSIAALVQHNGQWTDFRCRSSVGTDNVEAMVQIIAPQVQKVQPGTPVFFVHDGNNARFAAELMQRLESISAQDITVEDQLWRLMGES
jgi:hypothetical protein